MLYLLYDKCNGFAVCIMLVTTPNAVEVHASLDCMFVHVHI